MKRFVLISSLLLFACLSPALAQFRIDAKISSSWVAVNDGDLNADQDEVIFGPVATGTVIDRDFQFLNKGSSTVIVQESSTGGAEFRLIIRNKIVPPGQTVDFTLRYTAGATSKDPVITILNSSPGATANYTFRVLGLVLPNSYTFEGKEFFGSFMEITSGATTPSSEDGTLFEQPYSFGSSETSYFKITNTGSGPITFTSQSFSGPQAAEFSVGLMATLPFTLEAGEEETFGINWEPLGSGQDDATFELVSALSPIPFTFALRGTVVAGADIEVREQGSFFPIIDRSPTSQYIERIDYGLVDLGTVATHTFEIENDGFDPLFVSSITSDNVRFQVNSSISSIAAGASQQFSITFGPDVLGAAEALISIESNAPGDSSTFNFITQGVGENDTGSPEIMVTSTPLGSDIPPLKNPTIYAGTDFRKVATGSAATREFTISNIGSTPLAITSITLDNPAQFSVPPLNTSIPAGGETSFTVTFQPTVAAEHQAVITIVNDDPDAGLSGSESPYQLQISGTGVVQAPDIAVSLVDQPTIPNGSAPSSALGTLFPTAPWSGGAGSGYTFEFRIENQSPAPLEIVGVTTESPYQNDFFGDSITIEGGGSSALYIGADFPGPGTYHRTITIFSDDGDEGIFTFDVQMTLTGDDGAPRILAIAENGNDIELTLELPGGRTYFIDESEDLTNWSLMPPPSFSGTAGIQTRTLSGRAIPPASGQRFFRLRLDK